MNISKTFWKLRSDFTFYILMQNTNLLLHPFKGKKTWSKLEKLIRILYSLYIYSWFHIKGTSSVHSFNEDYLSISEGTGSCGYLFHEIPCNSIFVIHFLLGRLCRALFNPNSIQRPKLTPPSVPLKIKVREICIIAEIIMLTEKSVISI